MAQTGGAHGGAAAQGKWRLTGKASHWMYQGKKEVAEILLVLFNWSRRFKRIVGVHCIHEAVFLREG